MSRIDEASAKPMRYCWMCSSSSRHPRVARLQEFRPSGEEPGERFQLWGYCDQHWKEAQEIRGEPEEWTPEVRFERHREVFRNKQREAITEVMAGLYHRLEAKRCRQ